MTTSRKTSDTSERSDLSSTIANSSSNTNTPSTAGFPSKAERDFHEAQETNDPGSYDDEPVRGWPQVAKLMAETPDFACFPRHTDLNMKSLLYYHVELTCLKKELHRIEWDDNLKGVGDVREYAMRADYLTDPFDLEEECNKKQWKLIKRIRVLLKEYNKALLLYTQLSSLPRPESSNMRTFRKWLRESSDETICISGDQEQHAWGNLYEKEDDGGCLPRQFFKLLQNLIWPKSPASCDLDLVATRHAATIDGFTRWVADDFVPFYHNVKKNRSRKKRTAGDPEKASRSSTVPNQPYKKEAKPCQKDTLSTYSENAMLRFTSSVSTVIACLLPTVAITVLSKVHGLNNLLICLAAFATVFSMGLIYLTTSSTSRIEIFTATAAFSAVLVVFISVPTVPA